MARQSPALIVAMLALFVALTGTAVATTSALIGSAQIRNNSITGLDVKNRSLRPIDFRGSVRGPRGLVVCPAGPQRPAGPATGPAGGDLTGTTQTHRLAADAVTSARVIDASQLLVYRKADIGAVSTTVTFDPVSIPLRVVAPTVRRLQGPRMATS